MDPLEPTLLVSLTGSVNWTVGFLTTVAIFAIVALALNLQWGYTGIFNFGVVGFFMVGAYATALLTLPPPGQFESHIWGLGLPVPVGWLAAAAAGGLLALVIGLPTLRLQQDFLRSRRSEWRRSCAASQIPQMVSSTAGAASTASPGSWTT